MKFIMAQLQTLGKELLIKEMKKSIPILSSSLHKGECGRIAVIGGSPEYSGAPYFAAISALRLGADLVHVFCAKEASSVIKSYSPELIVHSLLDSPNCLASFAEWIPRMHAVVLGPGLGRDANVLRNVSGIIKLIKQFDIPLVIDADGLFYINTNPQVIHGCKNVILTPNVVEFNRLFQSVIGISIDPSQPPNPQNVLTLANQLGRVTILHKAENDIISDGVDINICEKLGSPRRCGGQGDLLSGMLATLLYWKVHDYDNDHVTLSAACAASNLCRMVNRKAFEIHGRGTLTSDMIPFISVAFRELFGQE